MSLENELYRNLNKLNTKDIKPKPKPQLNNDKNEIIVWIKGHIPHLIFALIFLYLCVSKFIINSNDALDTNNDVVLTKTDTQNKQKTPQKTQNVVKTAETSEPQIAHETQTENLNEAIIDENLTSKVEPLDQWQSKIEYLFLNKKMNVKLDMQYPIIEVGSLNLASNMKMELPEQNAFVEPIYFTTRGNEIVLNIKIGKADEREIYITKSYKLSDYGFKPLYFHDSIVYKNQVYLTGDEILFFKVKSIENRDNFTKITLDYIGQDIVIIQENNGNK